MALQSKTEIYIGSTPITSYKRFVLDQGINAHHFLRLECRTDVLENLRGEISNTTKNYLGETLTLQVTSLSEYAGYKALEFKGVVTAVASKKGYNNEHIVTINAESPTVLCDDGPHYNSYLDKTLSEVLLDAFQGYDVSKLSTAINPQNTAPIHYTVQHKESNWRYASRLAMQYGEWLYYDGKKLVFGIPENEADVPLSYGQDLQGFSLDLIPLPNNFNYFTNDYLSDEKHEKKTAEINTGVNGYNGFVSERSKTLYAKETNVWVNGFNDPQLKQRMDTHVEQQKKAVETQQVRLKGDSDNPGVGIGKVVDVKGETESHGRYRVIKVRHTNNENGQYSNTFEAVSADIDVFPDTNFEATPKSDTQTAVVMENADPDGLARIKVQFPWQKVTGEITPWIRVVTPHGGGEKGFHFIPEIGEEVLVGFEGANAERPYMMGSLYNGNNKAGAFQSDANDIKAIKTRSGHTIEFNDSNGAESITIKDKNSNTIFIDSANNSIEVTANETMTLSAKNIKIVADENINMVAGKDLTKSISENYNVMTKNNTVIVEENLSTDAKKQVNVADEITVSSNNENLTLTSGKTVDVQSKEKVKLF